MLRNLSRTIVRPQPSQLRQAAALYSRGSGRHDGLGGWYNERLRATTILSVRKDDKLVCWRPKPLAGGSVPTWQPRGLLCMRFTGASGDSVTEGGGVSALRAPSG